MNILIHGIGGKMGKALYNSLKNYNGATAVVGVDKFANAEEYDIPVYSNLEYVKEKIDCIIDFSVKQAVYELIPYALEHSLPIVIATTGYTDEENNYIKEASSQIAIFKSGNMSFGIYVINKLVAEAARLLGDKADIEIVEAHHNQKVDAPSGTALMLLNSVKQSRDVTPIFGREGQVGKRTPQEVGMHAIRGGSIVGKHEVMFIMNNEIITVKHEAESKVILALGSIKAALFLVKQSAGLYDMNDLLN